MRKIIVGLLLASVAAGPALADDDDDRGRGHKKWQKVEREWRGGGRDWNRARFDRPRFVRVERRDWDDDDDDDNDRWEGRRAFRQNWRDDRRAWREQQRYLRQVAREQRHYQPIERVIRHGYTPRHAERYYAPARYNRQPVRYYEAASYGYAPVSYAAAPYGFDQGLFGGGGNGILGALLPIVLSSVIGGDLGGSLGGLGGLSSLAGVGGLGGLGGLTNVAAYQEGYNEPYYDAYAGYPVDQGYSDYGNFSDYGSYAAVNELTGTPYSVPLQQVSYADPLTGGLIPASYSGGDLSSLLLPALLNQGGSLF